jgi:hypothetical protein
MKAIKLALDNWPSEFRRMGAAAKSEGARRYSDHQYKTLGL